METKTTVPAFHEALYGNSDKESRSGLQTSIKTLFHTLYLDDVADEVVKRVQLYAIKAASKTCDMDIDRMHANTTSTIRNIVREELTACLSHFLSDEHRKTIVCYHARGFPTSNAVVALIAEDDTLCRFAQEDALGRQELIDILIPRFAYLKPGNPRWPERKYGKLWREEREEYRQEVMDIPFVSPIEQIALLAQNSERLIAALESNRTPVEKVPALSNSLTRTFECMQKLGLLEQPVSTAVSARQLLLVLERLTLALEASAQPIPSEDTEVIVGALEKLVAVLKTPPGQKAITAEPEENTPKQQRMGPIYTVSGGAAWV